MLDSPGLLWGWFRVELVGGLLDLTLDLCLEVWVVSDHSAEDCVAAEEGGETGWAEPSGFPDGFNQAWCCALWIGALVEDGPELLLGDGFTIDECGGFGWL